MAQHLKILVASHGKILMAEHLAVSMAENLNTYMDYTLQNMNGLHSLNYVRLNMTTS